MKVLLINAEHALMGGAHTVYLNMADMLKKAGHEVVFFAMHSANEIPCEQSNFFSKVNDRNKVVSYVMNSFYNRDAADCLKELLKVEHPDIAHVHLMWGSLSPSILDVLKKNRIPVVHTVHDYSMICSHVTLRSTNGDYVCERCSGGHYFQCVRTRCHNGSLIKSLISTAEICTRNKWHHPVDYISHFNFVSEFCANKHKEMDTRFTNAQISVIYNVPDAKVVDVAKRGMSDSYNSYYLYYGRLAYEKGLETLITAFMDNPQYNLKIVGTGPLENSLKTKCEKALSKNIEFLGFRKGEELYELVRNAKFVCVPSEWYENCPMTVIEGFTLGTPVIGARIGGIPELVADGITGFLFESGQVTSLIGTLEKSALLSETDYFKMRNDAQNVARVRFNRDNYIEKIVLIYNQTINEYFA